MESYHSHQKVCDWKVVYKSLGEIAFQNMLEKVWECSSVAALP